MLVRLAGFRVYRNAPESWHKPMKTLIRENQIYTLSLCCCRCCGWIRRGLSPVLRPAGAYYLRAEENVKQA